MKTVFACIVPDIQSAIKISGNGCIRLTLEIPESEMPQAIKLVAAKGKVITADLSWSDE